MRPVLAIALAFLAAVTSLAAGVARGQADPVGQIVLCTGHGPVMVHVDETGAPTGAPVLCPDGVLALFDHSVAGPAAAKPALRLLQTLVWAPEPLASRAVPVPGKARSPPQVA